MIDGNFLGKTFEQFPIRHSTSKKKQIERKKRRKVTEVSSMVSIDSKCGLRIDVFIPLEMSSEKIDEKSKNEFFF